MSLEPHLPRLKKEYDHPSNANYLMNANTPRFSVPDHLPPKAALALFDYLSGLANAVWQHYEPVLVDLIMAEMNTPPDECDEIDPDFDDEVPF